MIAKSLCAVVLAAALLGCRDEVKEVVVVDSQLRHAHAADPAQRQADAFEHAVAADAGRASGCEGIVIVEDRALRAGPVYEAVRQPHWVLAISYVGPISSERGSSESWLLV